MSYDYYLAGWLAHLQDLCIQVTRSRIQSPAVPKFEYLCNPISVKDVSLFYPPKANKRSTSCCLELTCDGSMSRPGGSDSRPLYTTETKDKYRIQRATRLKKGFS